METTEASLDLLRRRLDQVNRAWSPDHYRALIDFYVRMLPRLMHCQRCGVFVQDPVTGRIRSTAGTGLDSHVLEPPEEDSVVGRVMRSGELCIDNELERRPGFHLEAARQTGFATRSLLCVPVHSLTDGRVMGALELLNSEHPGGFSEADVALLQEVASYLAMALENVLITREILAISERLNREVAALREGPSPHFIAQSPPMRRVIEQVKTVAPLPIGVYVGGENGTGKEQVARLIHNWSSRREQPFVAINCAAIPEALMESELFGYEKGAFTGAAGSRAGRFEEASGGTLFLDEVADMPPAMQVKLLRVLQEGEGARLGSNRLRRYDLRVVCASNKPLKAEVAAGRFREDLYYRLFALELVLPPLRERPADIAPLAAVLLEETCARFNRPVPGIGPELLRLFEVYRWPGNVRQLRREIERLVALSPEGGTLRPELCSPDIQAEAPGTAPLAAISRGVGEGDLQSQLDRFEQALILATLEAEGGNKLAAARRLGITRQGLYKKLKRHGLEPA